LYKKSTHHEYTKGQPNNEDRYTNNEISRVPFWSTMVPPNIEMARVKWQIGTLRKRQDAFL
jgi:hypothetical protein